MVKKQVVPGFGPLARKIIIEIDEKGAQRVTSTDYMRAINSVEEGRMSMIYLPKETPTDTRMMVMSLIGVIGNHLNAIFSAMEIGGNNAKT